MCRPRVPTRSACRTRRSAYAKKIVPEARGEAERILQGAKGYQQQTVAEATGQTARFLKVYEEYKKAPDVTRKRLYLETMERVLGGAEKIIIDGKARPGRRAVPAARPAEQAQGRGQLMMRALSATIVVILALAAAAAYFAFFIVHQNEQAIVLEFGKSGEDHQRAWDLYCEDPDRPDGRLLRQAHSRSRHRLRRK